MTRLSELIKRPVVCKEDCALLGTVEDAYFDENCRNIVYFVLFDEYRKLLLPYSAAAAIGDAVMVEDKFALLSPEDADCTVLTCNLLGKPVFTGGGKSKGTLQDVLFGAKGRVNALQSDGTAYSPSSFKAFGDVLLLKDVTVKRKTPKTTFPKAAEDRKVTVLPAEVSDAHTDNAIKTSPVPTSATEPVPTSATEPVPTSAPEPAPTPAPATDTPSVKSAQSETTTVSNAAETAFAYESAPVTPVSAPAATASTKSAATVIMPTADKKETPAPLDNVSADNPTDYNPVYPRDAAGEINVLFNQDDFTPHRIIADYNFLLGRVLQEDLRSYVGEKLASKGERVTVELVEKSRRHGKLIELTLNSR